MTWRQKSVTLTRLRSKHHQVNEINTKHIALQPTYLLTLCGMYSNGKIFGTLILQITFQGQGCPRCFGVVFAAELVLSKGREWHRKCFKCNDCSKTLDSIIACDGPDRDVYCKTCYGKKWGPHGNYPVRITHFNPPPPPSYRIFFKSRLFYVIGYGFACGSGFLQTDGLT